MAWRILIGPLDVYCGCCRGKGLICCADARLARSRLDGMNVLRRMLWDAYFASRKEARLARSAVADWYEEHGLTREAEWVRKRWDPYVVWRLLGGKPGEVAVPPPQSEASP